jgi:hypothetical protein
MNIITRVFFTHPDTNQGTIVEVPGKFQPSAGDRLRIEYNENCEIVLTFELLTRFHNHPHLSTDGVLTYFCNADKATFDGFNDDASDLFD